MLQSSGLGNSLNALTSLLLPYQIPVLIVVSMRGDAGEWNAAQVPMGRAVRSIFDAIGVPHSTVESAERGARDRAAVGKTAFGTRTMGACLLPRRSDGAGRRSAGTGRGMTRLDRRRHDSSRSDARHRRSRRRRGDHREPRPSGVRSVRRRRSPANFYTWGSMGLASSIGLGLALARPDLRVFVLDGDGSLLMNLGSLATIGWLQPANLVLVVMDNEEYAHDRRPGDGDRARRRSRRRRARDGHRR